MAYTGLSIPIPMGRGSLHTDDSQSSIPPTDYIIANNVQIFDNQIEKMAGSRKFNSTSLGSEIVGMFDWFPTATIQRLIALTANGKVYRDTGDKTFTGQVAIESDLGTLTSDVQMVEGGSEVTGNDKKLFIYTGQRQVQKITADGVITEDISNPAADWATSFPKFGILHRGRMFAFGNGNSKHRVYASPATDHEDFVGAGILTFDVFPGEGDELVSAFIFKGRLYIFKRPFGVYFLEDSDTTDTNWFFRKLSDSFGISSPHASIQAINDALVGNASGSITSMAATLAFGDIESGDTLSLMRIEQFIRDNTSAAGIPFQQAIYYEEKKVSYFTYRSTVNTANDRILVIDFTQKERPRATFVDKDQPSCLALRKDDRGIKRPIYGNSSGTVFEMDQEDRDVGGSGYTGEIQIPYTDFGFADPKLTQKNKLYDFLEVVYEAQGDWDLSVDVFIDGKFMETINYKQALGSNTLGTLVLGTDKLSRQHPEARRRRLHGMGRRISFRVYNSTVGQNFKLHGLVVSFRPSAEGQIQA